MNRRKFMNAAVAAPALSAVGEAQNTPVPPRQAIQEKQPDCYQWLLKEFGPR